MLEIEKKTRGQAATKALLKVWGEERTRRLHSSMFGRICKWASATDGHKLANTLTTRSNISSKATNHGRKNESVAIRKFAAKSSKTVSISGIIVGTSNP